MKKSLFFVFVLVITLMLWGCAKKPVSYQSGKGPASQEKPEKVSGAKQQGKITLQGEGLEKKEVKEFEVKEKTTPDAQEKAILGERIHFAFDSYDLTEESREILKKKAEILLKHPDIKVIIEGHCDERGTNEYNLALGERRARAAYEYLILLGVDADRMSIISYGEERPLDPRHNEEAWAKNRRDEFKIIIKNQK